MNAATRGVILAVIGVALAVFILGRGFDDTPDLVSVGAVDPPPDTTAPDPDEQTDTTPTEDAETPTEDPDPATDDETTTETPAVDETPAATDPPPILHTISEVRLLVVNGTGVGGAAGTVNNSFIALGYNGLEPTNSNSPDTITETKVYYAEAYILDAQSIALALNAPTTAVAPLTDDVPVDELSEAHVVIVLGSDLVPAT